MPNSADFKSNRQFAIYPCFRVDVDPPRKPLPAISLPHEEKDHPKSHRQMLATYTKRSLASSQEQPHNQRLPSHTHHEGMEKTTANPIPKPQE
jgi:hypothetical protein